MVAQIKAEHLGELLDVAIDAAKSAGELIESYRHKAVAVKHKGLGASIASEVVTEVDLLSQSMIEAKLSPSCEKFNIAFVGEESASHSSRFEKPYTWLVDPIDGTLSFIEKKEGYSVSIALINQKGIPILGVVFDPFNQKLYYASVGDAVLKNNDAIIANKTFDRAFKARTANSITCFLDRNYKEDDRCHQLLSKLDTYSKGQGLSGVTIVSHMGAALNACRVVETKPSIYLKFPKEKGGSIWDYAASAAIFTALELPVSDLYGEPLELNRIDSTYMNHKGFIYSSYLELYTWALDAVNELL